MHFLSCRDQIGVQIKLRYGRHALSLADKHGAYATLYDCLLTLIKLIAPVMPFMTEQMYQNLAGSTGQARASIHLDDFPVAEESLIDQRLSDATRLAMRLSSMGRAARSKAGIRVRQPLQTMKVLVPSKPDIGRVEGISPQLKEEVNVKEVKVTNDEINFWDWKVPPNLRVLGPRYGARVREITEGLAAMDPRQVVTRFWSFQPIVIPSDDDSQPPIVLGFSGDQALRKALASNFQQVARQLDPENDTSLQAFVMEAFQQGMLVGYVDSPEEATQYPFDSGMHDLLIERVPPDGYVAVESAGYTVAISTEVTSELAREGLTRDLIRRIQNMRKSAGFDVTDRIVIRYEGDEEIKGVFQYYGMTIKEEVLANDIEPPPILFDSFPKEPDGYKEIYKFDGHELTLWIRKED